MGVTKPCTKSSCTEEDGQLKRYTLRLYKNIIEVWECVSCGYIDHKSMSIIPLEDWDLEPSPYKIGLFCKNST
ncbi:MAG: hypothetical protein ACFFCE_01715 [Promethearchaeota archaeon]